MGEISELAGRTAGLLALAAFVPYILSILRGGTRPNRATWWIWTIVGLLLGSSYYASGAQHTMWVPISYIIGPLVAAVLSLRYGEGGWTAFDRRCIFVALLSLPLWWFFQSPLIALLMNLFIDFLGALPTIRKSYFEPEGEDRLAWALFFAGNVANLFAIEGLTFVIVVYPAYMFLASGTITFLVLRPRKLSGQVSH